MKVHNEVKHAPHLPELLSPGSPRSDLSHCDNPTMRFFALLAGTQLASALYENGSVIAPCDSPIYCYGDLLREIELARPFADSKTFVDL